MSRRIGIITFEMPKNTRKQDPPPGQGGGNQTPQSQHYIWDIKSLSNLEFYAQELSNWTRLDIIELIWCRMADVSYDPALPKEDRRIFTFLEKEERKKRTLPGSLQDGYTEEYRAVCFFRQEPLASDRIRSRRVGIPAPVFHLFGEQQRIIGEALAHHLSQATGLMFTFVSGYLRSCPVVVEEY